MTTKQIPVIPRGSGSVQKRGRVYWMIYRNTQGRIMQESSGLTDYDAALRLLASRALAAARHRVMILEQIERSGGSHAEAPPPKEVALPADRHGAAKRGSAAKKARAADPRQRPAGVRAEQSSRSESVRNNPAKRAQRNSAAATTTKGARR